MSTILTLSGAKQLKRATRLVEYTKEWEDNYTIDVSFPSRHSTMEFPDEVTDTLAKWVKAGEISNKRRYCLWVFYLDCEQCRQNGSFECDGHDLAKYPMYFRQAMKTLDHWKEAMGKTKEVLLTIEDYPLRKLIQLSDSTVKDYWEGER